MKVLLVSSAFYPYPSGISEHVYYLAKELKNRGHRVKILTTNYPKRWKDEEVFDLSVIRVGRVILLPLNRSFATLPFGFEIPFFVKRFLEKEEFDIIHLHGLYPPEIGFWVLVFAKTTICCTFHTRGFKRLPFSQFASLSFRPYTKKLVGRIAVSQAAKEWIEPFLPGEYRIIPNGVDTDRFSPNLISREREDGEKIILFVGRLDKRKGAHLAIESFPLIKKRFPKTRLLIVGQGPEERSLLPLVKKIDPKRINFLGYVSRKELPSFYASCDVYISPALGGESQGIVLLEAMACGKPVVASNIEGYREVVTDGENGLLFNPKRVDELAEKVSLILKDGEFAKILGERARKRAEEYSWKRIAKRIEEYYLELLEKAKGRSLLPKTS